MLVELTLLTTFALQHLLIGTCLFLVLALISRVFGISAELQSWLWITAVALCVLVPFASLVQGTGPLSATAEYTGRTEPAVREVTQEGNDSAGASETASARSSTGTALQWKLSGLWLNRMSSWLYGFLLIWLLGGAWRAIHIVRSIRRTRGLVRSATPYNGRGCAIDTIRCPILVSESARAPMATGLARPVIILPQILIEQFDTERLAPIILHEWAHIQRRDLWVGAFQELIAIVFWWSPVMRWLKRKIHISRELACDIRAAKVLESGKRYAQSLLDCAELMITREQNALAMGLFRKKKDLTERVNAVLKLKTKKIPKLPLIATACSVFAIASLAAAQGYAPRIDLSSIVSEAEYAYGLSRVEGELMIEAIRGNDFETVNEMLNNGLNINIPVLGEGTALIEAARQNNREMVDLLIGAGADVNLPSRGDGNPMIAAARHNHMELAGLLHQYGADPNAAVQRDGTPLIVAIRSGHDAMAEQLLEWGADVNQSAKWDGSPLIAAAMTGNLEMAQRLYRAGADINGVVATDETPLINASHHGHFEMVRFLLENGADVNLGVKANGDEFRTPLNRARNSEIRGYLIGMGAAK